MTRPVQSRRTENNDVVISLDQWQQTQPPNGAALEGRLSAGQLYEVDGGVFQTWRTAEGHWELWTWMGKAGHEVTRTGFEIDAQGRLYDRLYDLEAGEALVLTPARFALDALRPVSETLLATMQGELARLRGRIVS